MKYILFATLATFAVVVSLLITCGPMIRAEQIPLRFLPRAHTANETIIHTFVSLSHGGYIPSSDLLAGEHGPFYGTTVEGSRHNGGVAFSLTPPAASGGTWTETILSNFEEAVSPSAVISGADGSLYGTTFGGGSSGCFCGYVFKLTPRARGSRWTKQVLYTFHGHPDGEQAGEALLPDGHGGFYGTTTLGGTGPCGSFGCGTVFEVDPPRARQNSWTEIIIHSFTYADGSSPRGHLIADSAGDLFGVTGDGGAYNVGTVYKLTPPSSGSGDWSESVLHDFSGTGGDGASPASGLLADASGALYGTTTLGGAAPGGFGTVFKLSPPRHGSGSWTERILYAFTSVNGDGNQPYSDLIADRHGALYGTTLTGGNSCRIPGCGIVFKLSPPQAKSAMWTETVLHEFSDDPDGSGPKAGLTPGLHGLLYGTTTRGGGTENGGTVFELLP